MRDHRFVAQHRGGPLGRDAHRLLAAWAAACAERVLPLVEAHRSDPRPRTAVATAQAWAVEGVPAGRAMQAARDAHAAARLSTAPAAVAAARAAGHAAATAHAADHALGAAMYALRAVAAAGEAPEVEHAWQRAQLPEEVRDLVTSALGSARFRTFAPGLSPS